LLFSPVDSSVFKLQLKLGLEEIIRLDRNCDTDDRLLERWIKTGISYRKTKFPVAIPVSEHVPHPKFIILSNGPGS
jgi:hypothetical protein